MVISIQPAMINVSHLWDTCSAVLKKNNRDSIRVKILYDDRDIIVVNKPGGMLCVPGKGPAKQDCVVSRLLTIFPDIINQPAVHRLDMQTSGVMIFGKNKQAHRLLSKQFENRTVKKQYVALLDGKVTQKSGTIKLKFRLDPDNRPYQIYDPVHGKLGVTHFSNMGIESDFTRMLFTPITGRTHQLRLHSSHPLGLGTPVVGDFLYGNGADGDKMYLHAVNLTLQHPSSDEIITFKTDVPF